MSIQIHQSLHGYQNGHQLLASSMELSNQLKKVLLFQTDLSGSSVVKGFESYITGYPLEESSLYVLSKTWYAEEMKRPGCVWTHSLLISFADLSIISEFEMLLEFFKRPVAGEYSFYDSPVVLEDHTFSHNTNRRGIDMQEQFRLIWKAVYDKPEKTIIVPSNSSQEFEKSILSIWSNEWPRLRRNFFFCTGALSLKTLDEREFDIQVVPKTSLAAIERQSQNIHSVGPDMDTGSNWLDIFTIHEKIVIRDFLWKYGSDIEGSRKKFVPLLELFEAFQQQDPSLMTIAELFNKYFPSKKEARVIKLQVFGKGSRYNEKELLRFLITQADISFIDLSELNLEERLVELLNRDEIEISEFFDIVDKAEYERISDSIWKSADLNLMTVLDCLDKFEYSKESLKGHVYFLMLRNKSIFLNWLSKKGNNFSPFISEAVFSICDFQDLHRLDLNFNAWKRIYHNLKQSNNEKLFISGSAVILSIGFRNEIRNSERLVSLAFDDVFRFASKSKIDDKTWDFIPKDEATEEFEDRMGLLRSFFTAPRKRKLPSAPKWDYCEILIRTLVNLFIKHGWDRQAFIDSLKNEEEYRRVFGYSQSFPKGSLFFIQVIDEIERGKIKLTKEQQSILARLDNF